ncbi:MAG: family hydrolase [Frankiales bacterium]|nr:family hydrolase [Frankiales bacterium]
MLKPSSAPLHEVYDAALLDLDGVLYLDSEPIAQAAGAVETARAGGMRTAFVTNNSSRRASTVAEHLSELGIAATAQDVVTSSQAVVSLLQRRLPSGATVLVVGSDGLADELAEGGFVPVREARGVAAVVQGLEPRTAWTDLAEAAVAIAAGALWVAGNTDSTFPSPRGLLPGNGAMVQALVHTTGRRPVVVGKPEPELFRASVARVGAERPLVVGDRLDTDIAGANRAGLPSLLVLTGVTTREDLLAAPPDHRPTYVSSDLRGLVTAHPDAVVSGDTARCREATAGPDGASDDSDDALRAMCSLAWVRSGS